MLPWFRIEEVGAGTKTFKDYCPLFYAGCMPEIEDIDTFRCALKLENGNQGSNQGSQILNEKQLDKPHDMHQKYITIEKR